MYVCIYVCCICCMVLLSHLAKFLLLFGLINLPDTPGEILQQHSKAEGLNKKDIWISATETANPFDRLTHRPDICVKINPSALYILVFSFWSILFMSFSSYFKDATFLLLLHEDDPNIELFLLQVLCGILEVCSWVFNVRVILLILSLYLNTHTHTQSVYIIYNIYILYIYIYIYIYIFG